MGQPEALALMRADNRKLGGDLKKSEKMFSSAFTRIGKRIGQKLSAGISRVALSGVSSLVAVGKTVLDFETTLTRIGINAGQSGKELDVFREGLINLSKATGISRGKLIQATKSLVDLTGPAGLSIELLGVLAEANLATGTTMEDLAKLTSGLADAFGIVDPDQLTKALGGAIAAGNEAKIPLNEIAVTLDKVGASFARVSSGGAEGAAELVAALQVLRKSGFAGSAEAGTGFETVIAAITMKAKALEKVLGKDGVFDPETEEIRNTFDILRDLNDLKLTEKQISKIFPGKEELKAVLAFGDKGLAMFEKLKATNLAAGEATSGMAKTFLDSVGGKMQKASNNLAEAMAKVWTPERLDMFVNAMDKAASFLGFIVDHIKEFALIFASIKIAGFAAHMSGIATSAAATSVSWTRGASGIHKIGTSTAAAATATQRLAGAMGKAAGFAAAFTTGLAVGTAIDKKFKISDTISKGALESEEISGSGNLRERAKDIEQAALQAFISKNIGGDAPDPTEVLRDALSLVRQSKEQGIGREDALSRNRANLATDRGESLTAFREFGVPTEKAELLLSALDAAQGIVAEAAKFRKEKIEIVITVNQEGQITAVPKERLESAE